MLSEEVNPPPFSHAETDPSLGGSDRSVSLGSKEDPFMLTLEDLNSGKEKLERWKDLFFERKL